MITEELKTFDPDFVLSLIPLSKVYMSTHVKDISKLLSTKYDVIYNNVTSCIFIKEKLEVK